VNESIKEKRDIPDGSRKRTGTERMTTVSELRNQSGFTLIEIAIAMLILVIALLGLISVTVMVTKGNSFSKTLTTATTMAMDKMEEIKNASVTKTGYNNLAGGTETLQSIYTRTWTVNNSPAGMKTINVQVMWNWQNANRDVTLRSIVAE
jgi:prepilin-type N-terminal cleavage/methylation domain-containing protein